MNSRRPFSRTALLLATTFGLPTVVACGEEAPLPVGTAYEPPAGPTASDTEPTALQREVTDLYESILDATQGYAVFMCECEIQGTQETLEECVWRTSPPIAPPIARCTQEVLATDESALPALECTAQERKAYLECVESSTCLDFENQLGCQIDILQATVCPSVPWELWARNEVECIGNLPPESFDCADGSKVSLDWVCDGEADCPDASDEHTCF